MKREFKMSDLMIAGRAADRIQDIYGGRMLDGGERRKTLARVILDAVEEMSTKTEASHSRRVTDLLEANNRYQQEGRDARALVRLADALRAAQRAYMADRGNEALGKAVGAAAAAYDAARAEVGP
jgi:hypothetical protein